MARTIVAVGKAAAENSDRRPTRNRYRVARPSPSIKKLIPTKALILSNRLRCSTAQGGRDHEQRHLRGRITERRVSRERLRSAKQHHRAAVLRASWAGIVPPAPVWTGAQCGTDAASANRTSNDS